MTAEVKEYKKREEALQLEGDYFQIEWKTNTLNDGTKQNRLIVASRGWKASAKGRLVALSCLAVPQKNNINTEIQSSIEFFFGLTPNIHVIGFLKTTI